MGRSGRESDEWGERLLDKYPNGYQGERVLHSWVSLVLAHEFVEFVHVDLRAALNVTVSVAGSY